MVSLKFSIKILKRDMNLVPIVFFFLCQGSKYPLVIYEKNYYMENTEKISNQKLTWSEKMGKYVRGGHLFWGLRYKIFFLSILTNTAIY